MSEHPSPSDSLERYLGNTIRDLRQKHDLTIADVATLAGISRGMLSKIENAQTATSLDTLSRLASALGAKVGDTVGLGASRLRMAAVLSFESDRGANFFSLLPRLTKTWSQCSSSVVPMPTAGPATERCPGRSSASACCRREAGSACSSGCQS